MNPPVPFLVQGWRGRGGAAGGEHPGAAQQDDAGGGAGGWRKAGRGEIWI